MSSLFLIFPLILSLNQLHNEIKHCWLNDSYTRQIIYPWLTTHINVLYSLSILTGSSFTAIEFCNSNLFQLNVCYMNLNRNAKQQFKNKRLFSIVFFENIPQLLMQIVYITLSIVEHNDNNDNDKASSHLTLITIFAMIFSFLSIILALFEWITKSYLLNTETKLFLTFNVYCEEIIEMSRKEFYCVIECQRFGVSNEIGKILHIDGFGIELFKPISTDDGALLIFNIRNSTTTTKSNILTLIEDSIDTQRLPKALKNVYKLSELPIILHVKTQVIFGTSNQDITDKYIKYKSVYNHDPNCNVDDNSASTILLLLIVVIIIIIKTKT